MTWTLPAAGPRLVAEFGLTWLCQASALLAAGLVAGRWLRGSGPAVQSAAYRTTLAAVLLCPLASSLLAAAGCDALTFRLAAPRGVAAAEAPAITPLAAPSATPDGGMDDASQGPERLAANLPRAESAPPVAAGPAPAVPPAAPAEPGGDRLTPAILLACSPGRWGRRR